jgi:hypothetical protein
VLGSVGDGAMHMPLEGGRPKYCRVMQIEMRSGKGEVPEDLGYSHPNAVDEG